MQALNCTAAAPALFSTGAVVGIIFLLTLAMVVAGAVIAVQSRWLVRSVAGLALCFTGVAGLYYFLFSPFLAMMQMLIYVGAVSILIAFAIMMVTQASSDTRNRRRSSALAGPIGFSVAMLFFAVFTILAVATPWRPQPQIAQGTTRDLGMALLGPHVLVFELISVVLLMAIIGALVLAQHGRQGRQGGPASNLEEGEA